MVTRARRHDKQNTAPEIEDLARRIDGFARRRWASTDGLTCLTLGTGGDEVTLYAAPAAAEAFLETVSAAGAALEDARADLAAFQERVETLERELTTARDAGSESRRPDAARGATSADRAHAATLENVPAALIAPFHPDARTLAAAKENPLVALAVQATKAMQPDASELERARLLAMAYAASTGDMTRFWAARTQRSAKKMTAS
jgi:hypothetical protein